MTSAPAVAPASVKLDEEFPGVATPDTRKNYSGYLIAPDKLVEVATKLRDEAGYDYLSSATAVDYLDDGKLRTIPARCR